VKHKTVWLIVLLVLLWLLLRSRLTATTAVKLTLTEPGFEGLPVTQALDLEPAGIPGAVPWSVFKLTYDSFGSDAMNAAFFDDTDTPGGVAPSYLQHLRM
jgi:hypothetical protein